MGCFGGRHAGLAAIVLCAAAVPCTAQQFSIERDFDLLRFPNGRPLQNVYWVSLPLLPAIADVADSDSPLGNKCVGDPDGPLTPDGRIDSDDLICAWWTARQDPATGGTFTLSHVDRDTCTPVARNGSISLGRVRFAGVRFTPDREAGLQVLVTVPVGATYSPRNHAVLAGDHDDAWGGRVIRAMPTCPQGAPNCCGATTPRIDLLAVPYHALYASADEILCGLEGVDWADVDADGKPDTCWADTDGDGVQDPGEQPTGIFDGRVAASVGRFYNTPDANTVRSRIATVALGRLRFAGTDFALEAGEAYMVQLTVGHEPTLFIPPHR